MKIISTSFGGVREVPGSNHLLRVIKDDEKRIMHDYGSFHNINRDSEEPKTDLAKIDVMFISHGHSDHIGNLDKLIPHRYNGKIFCTPATLDLIKLQMEEKKIAEWFNTNRYNESIKGLKDASGKFIPFKKPGFNSHDFGALKERLYPVEYKETIEAGEGIKATFYDAGHIIGSSQVLYEIANQGEKLKILMCFDLGRKDIDTPLIRDPDANLPKDIDYIYIESTYGDRLHRDKEASREELSDIISRCYKENKKILCGAFSIMRTQLILEDLFRLHLKNRLPSDYRILLDSPTALKVNKIMLNHRECFDENAKDEFLKFHENAFDFPNLILPVKNENLYAKNPHMVLAASGMFNQGRIYSVHLENYIEKPESVILLTGYQAEGTLGRILQEGKEAHPTIKIKGKGYKFVSEINEIHGYSGHADANEITEHLIKMKNPEESQFKGIFIVHGEEQSSFALAKQLEKAGYNPKTITVPERYKDYELS